MSVVILAVNYNSRHLSDLGDLIKNNLVMIGILVQMRTKMIFDMLVK